MALTLIDALLAFGDSELEMLRFNLGDHWVVIEDKSGVVMVQVWRQLEHEFTSKQLFSGTEQEAIDFIMTLSRPNKQPT